MSIENISEQDNKILELRVAGKSYREIATELRISPSTVARCVQKHALVVSVAQHANLEEKLRQVGGLKADRIVRLAQVLHLIEERIDKIAIGDLEAPQLIDAMLKLHRQLDSQVGSIKLVSERAKDMKKDLSFKERIQYLDFDL